MIFSYKDLREEHEISRHIDNYYDKIGKLGAGSFGTVHKAIKKTTGTEVALKVISKERM